MPENNRGRFISIHGIDGTGKTKTAGEVRNKLEHAGIRAINYDIYKEGKENPHAVRKKEVDETGTVEERLAVYLESMMYHSERIESLLAQGFHVVKSRYMDDILAHFAHLGIPREKIQELEQKFPMVQPDLKVILQLDEVERRKRVETRGTLDDKDREEKKPGSRVQFFEDYLLEAAQRAPSDSILYVDTGKLDVDAVAQKIVDLIIKRKDIEEYGRTERI